MARALVHIVRVRRGVTHIDASPGIGSVEASELERLPVGDLSNPSSVARLASVPTVFGRRLRLGRYAITRILPALPEDGGPEAIDAVSLVMPSIGYAQAAGSLAQIALDERFWRIARLAVARGVDLPESSCATPAADPRALRAFDAWITARRRQGVAVLAPEDAIGILAMAGWLDAEDCAECRWGIGALTLDAPVDICTISPVAGVASSRPVIQPAVGSAWLSTEMQHAIWHLGGSPRFPPLRSLVSSVRVESARDRAGMKTGSSAPESEEHDSRIGIVIGAVIGVFLLVTAILLVRSLGTTRGTPDGDLLAAQRPGTDHGQVGDPRIARATAGREEPDPLHAAKHQPNRPDTDKDGVVDEEDCDPYDPSRGVTLEFFRDLDGDGAGDPNPAFAIRDCVAASAPAPPGYSRRNDDLCDQNPSRTSNGGCPCHWDGLIEDLNGNGIVDCLDDDDHDGMPRVDDPVDDRYRLCAEAAEAFGRARRELMSAANLLDEADARARMLARDKSLKGEALRDHERTIIEPSILAAKESIRAALWEIYTARRTVVFGDESFKPRSRADPKQVAPNVFPVATQEQFGLLRMCIEDLASVSARYARAYARHIHLGRPQRLIREDMQKEILARWTTGTLSPEDSLDAMRWVAGLVTKMDEEVDQEVRRIDEQLSKGRAAAPSPR